VSQAFERVLADDIVAESEIPHSDRSIVDGFAVKSTDTKGSSEASPFVLRIMGESKLGEACKGVVRRGGTFAIATGGIVPKGADSIVPVEDVHQLPDGKIALSGSAKRGENVLRKGEDIARGKVVLTRGRRLRAQDLGVLKVLGVKRVRVRKRPRVAILSTGNELVERLRTRSSSQIVDINRLVLSAKVRQLGGTVIDCGIVKDEKELITRALRKVVKSSDMVLVSGGSSVGLKDLVPSCINALGEPGMLVHGVAMRPAMPTGLASVNGVPVISLPGFPVSAMFAFLIFASPMIAKLSGVKLVPEAKLQARTSELIKGVKGYRTFVRVALRSTAKGFTARPIDSQRASVMMSVVAADGFVVVPEKTGLIRKGGLVNVTLLT
jgi:molybdopterin molybdotransferase